jgi:exodeoxyribonuclease X
LAAHIYLDTETTGNSKDDRLCQIAFLIEHVERDLFGSEKKPPKCHAELCKPPLPISFEAMSVNHITTELVENARAFGETAAVKKLTQLNKTESVMWIHNAPFDLSMLERENFFWKGKVIDTLRVSRHIIECESHSLQYMRYALGLYRQEEELCRAIHKRIIAHDALGDTIVLYLLAERLLSMRSVEEMIDLTDKPIKLRKIHFGKYKGKSFDEIASSDRGYLKWLYDSEKQKNEQNADLLYTIESLLSDGR